METDYSPLISVIVPIYNVEKYLKRCLDSLCKQTYYNLEIIMVNDGSTDKCYQICQEFLTKYSNFIYLEQDNAGPGSARNLGISYAKGDYIGFVDSDDFILPDMYKVLLENLIINDAQISICNRFRYSASATASLPKIEDINKDVLVLTGEDALMHLYTDTSKIKPAVWDKLYVRELFNDIRFPRGIFEDERVIYKALYCASRVVVSNLPLYIYCINPNSIITSHWDKKYLDDYILKIEEPIDYFSKKGRDDFINAVLYRALQSGIEMWEKLKISNSSSKEEISYLKSQIRIYYKDLRLCKLGLGKSQILKKFVEFTLLAYAPNLLSFIRNN